MGAAEAMDPILVKAHEARGNWKRFESFGWHGRPDDADEWCIVYTSNRDSGIRDQSNAAEIDKILSAFPEDECRAEHHGHWAVGHVDGYAIRVLDARGEPTAAFRAWCEIQDRLADYPLLNEEDVSDREMSDERESWGDYGASDFRRALAASFPHHGSDFWDAIPDEALRIAWYELADEPAEREDYGATFPFDDYLTTTWGGKPRVGWKALDWPTVRTALRDAIVVAMYVPICHPETVPEMASKHGGGEAGFSCSICGECHGVQRRP